VAPGFGDEPADLTDAALIMMDCQNTYHKGVYRRKKANIEAQRLLIIMRRLSMM
jgi:hypothetical protein